MLDNYRHLHIIGIGGSGISALAYLALAKGLKVSGSDLNENPVTDELKKEGVTIQVGHKKENLPDHTELVIFSEAIDRHSNPEYKAAKDKGIPVMSYFEALGKLSESKKTIVVTGTHGKTTTTAMLGKALAEADMDPTVIVGARVPAFENHNLRVGHSQWLVAEGCEYRRSFLSFQPFGVVLLNCELEHVDYYKDIDDYASAFWELASKIPEGGFLIYNEADEHCKKISEICRGKAIPVPLSEAQQFKLKLAGDFNKLNAAHAQKAAEQTGADAEKVRKALEDFEGTARRMEIKGEKEGVLVMDDYGHHPTEIKVTLQAAREKYPERRIVCVFQPHQYSRTHELLEGFKDAFSQADLVLIPNIFEARDTDEDKAKISAEKLANLIPEASFSKGLENTLKMLKEELKEGDLLLTMGAGDVYKVGEGYLK